MNSIVLVREVWDTRDLIGEIVNSEGQIQARLLTRFEPEDLNALEMALQIKDQQGGTVTVLSMGAPREVDVLREALYRDADAVIRLEDPAFSDLDTLGIAHAFSAAIRKVGDYGLILTGVSIPEGENAFLGTQIASLLEVPHASYVDAIEEVSDAAIVCKRGIEGGYESVRLPLPAVLVVGVALQKDDPRTPRSAKARLKLKHKKTPIPAWGGADLGLDSASLAAVTRPVRLEAVPQRAIETVEIDPEDETNLRAMLDEWRALR